MKVAAEFADRKIAIHGPESDQESRYNRQLDVHGARTFVRRKVRAPEVID
jgi:hypothetical protein